MEAKTIIVPVIQSHNWDRKALFFLNIFGEKKKTGNQI